MDRLERLAFGEAPKIAARLQNLAAPNTDERKTQSRFDVAMTRGLTPLVGRVQELALLHERWDHVKAGFGHEGLWGRCATYTHGMSEFDLSNGTIQGSGASG